MFTRGTCETAEHSAHPWAGAGRCGCPLVCHGGIVGNGAGWAMAAILCRTRVMVAVAMGVPCGAIGDVSADRSYYEAIWPASQSCKLRTQKTGTYGSVPARGCWTLRAGQQFLRLSDKLRQLCHRHLADCLCSGGRRSCWRARLAASQLIDGTFPFCGDAVGTESHLQANPSGVFDQRCDVLTNFLPKVQHAFGACCVLCILVEARFHGEAQGVGVHCSLSVVCRANRLQYDDNIPHGKLHGRRNNFALPRH